MGPGRGAGSGAVSGWGRPSGSRWRSGSGVAVGAVVALGMAVAAPAWSGGRLGVGDPPSDVAATTDDERGRADQADRAHGRTSLHVRCPSWVRVIAAGPA